MWRGVLVGAALLGGAGFVHAQVNANQITLPASIGNGTVATVQIDWERIAGGVAQTISTPIPNAYLAVEPPVPSGCSVAESPTRVVCEVPAGSPGDSGTISFDVRGAGLGGFSLVATPSGGGTSASQASNVVTAGDLQISIAQISPAGNAAAGQSMQFRVTPAIATGDNVPADASVVVTTLLPATAADFVLTNLGFTGLTPSCNTVADAQSTRTLICTYSGAFTREALNNSSITLTGRPQNNGNYVATTSIASGGPAYVDTNPDNNSATEPFEVDPGADLQPGGNFPGTPVETGSTQTLTLQYRNHGPMNAPAGGTVSTIVPDGFSVGTLPAGCSNAGAGSLTVGGTSYTGTRIDCTAGAVNSGNNQSFAIPLTMPDDPGNGNFPVVVAPPADFHDADPSNNGTTVAWQVAAPFADLGLTKSKNRGGPWAAATIVTHSFTVRNEAASTAPAAYTAANPLRVVDYTLPAEVDTTYGTGGVDNVSAGWTCAVTTGVTPPTGIHASRTTRIACQTTGDGSLAPSATTQLNFSTRLAAVTEPTALTNQACTGGSALAALNLDADAGPSPADPISGNDCATSVGQDGIQLIVTNVTGVNASVQKFSSVNGSNWFDVVANAPTLDGDDDTFHWRIVVTTPDNGQAAIPTLRLRDDFPGRVSHSGATQTTVTTTPATWGSCPASVGTSGVMQCDFSNVPPDTTITVDVAVQRPVSSGTLTNTATVSSPNAVLSATSGGQLSDQAAVAVTARFDLEVTSKTVTPNEPRVGEPVQFNITVRNNGPDSLTNGQFTLTDTVNTNPSAGSVAFEVLNVSGDNMNCTASNFSTGELSCTNTNTVARDANRTVVIQARVKKPTGGMPPTGNVFANQSNTAEVAANSGCEYRAGSGECNDNNAEANNSRTVTFDVRIPAIDMQQQKSLVFPAGQSRFVFGDQLRYRYRVQAIGPSRAEDVTMTDTLTVPDGFTLTLASGAQNVNGTAAAGGFTLDTSKTGTVSCSQSAANAPVTCVLNSTAADNFMDAGREVNFELAFNVTPATGDVPATFGNKALVCADETASYESSGTCTGSENGNNAATVNATMFPVADMEVVKSVSPSTVQLREPFEYTVIVKNNGPQGARGVTFADTLSAGMELTGAPTVQVDTGSFATTTCTGAAGQSAASCDFGAVSHDGQATITLPVRVTSWPSGGTLTNTASVAVDGDQTVDRNPDNNEDDVQVTVQRSSIAGRVYEDSNFNGAYGADEPGIQSVQLRLTGTDAYGNAVDVTTTTAADGTFTFQNLSPADGDDDGDGYTITQTQPEGWLDAYETAGSADGTAANAGFDGTEANNRVTAIPLPANTAATGYNFGEVRAGNLEGWVFVDGNANGARDAGETAGLPGLTVRLTGIDYTEAAVDRTVQTVDVGHYLFENVLPGTYTVTQVDLPGGMTYTGTQVGTVNTNPSGALDGGGPPQGVQNIALLSNGAGTNYNFGWSGQGLGGRVYVDLDKNGEHSAGDRPLAGVTVTLSGLTAGGLDVCAVISPQPCTATTDASGNYHFPNLPASNGAGYTLTQQAQSVGILRDYSAGPVTAGSLGGTGSEGNIATITGMVIDVGQSGAGYDFGHLAGSLAGAVWHDQDRDDTRDAGEPGLAGVTLTLSGTTQHGLDVCTVIGAAACSVQTAADGSYLFPNLPASDAGGYTLVQTQPADYLASVAAPGSTGGTAGETGGNRQVSGIALGAGEDGADYLFGHVTGDLSGYVYHDHAADGTRDPGTDTGLAGVTVTLSGTTGSGADVCAFIAPASCTATTDADGRYVFPSLPNGTYTLTRGPAPEDYQDKCAAPGLLPDASAHADCTAPGHTPQAISGVPFAVDPAAAEAHTEFNFSLVKPASIGGRVYLDVDGNGEYDEGEAQEGVTVTLTGTDDQGNPVNESVTTNPDGTYEFTNLRPSGPLGYTIEQGQPPGYGDFTENGNFPGTVNGIPVGTSDGPDRITGVVLPSEGGIGLGYDFRDQPSSLRGFVYLDVNDDGAKGAGEPGLAGVTVHLSGTDANDDPVNRTTTTGADGAFEFTGLRSGTYTLQQDHPAGYLDGRETAGTIGGVAVGTVDNTAFGPEPECNRITAITLGLAEHGVDYLFGEGGGFITGHVYVDADDDGQMGGSEAGLAGVVVYIEGTIDGGTDFAASRGCAVTPANCQATTGADGLFRFDGIPPGSYQLRKAQEQVNLLYETGGHPDYRDGRETAGVAGGSVNNEHFGSQPVFNTIADIAVTPPTWRPTTARSAAISSAWCRRRRPPAR